MVDDIIAKIESMFGNYKPAYKVAVKNVLAKLPPDKYEKIIQNLVIKFKSEYNQPPSIPTLLEMAEIGDDREAELEWLKLRNVSDMISIVVTNLKTQAVIESFGGWYEFCQQRDGNEYTHRDFIERYKNIRPADEPKVLRGYADVFWNSEIDYRKLKIVGDYNKGKVAIEHIKKKQEDKKAKEIEQLINKTIKYIE